MVETVSKWPRSGCIYSAGALCRLIIRNNEADLFLLFIIRVQLCAGALLGFKKIKPSLKFLCSGAPHKARANAALGTAALLISTLSSSSTATGDEQKSNFQQLETFLKASSPVEHFCVMIFIKKKTDKLLLMPHKAKTPAGSLNAKRQERQQRVAPSRRCHSFCSSGLNPETPHYLPITC